MLFSTLCVLFILILRLYYSTHNMSNTRKRPKCGGALRNTTRQAMSPGQPMLMHLCTFHSPCLSPSFDHPAHPSYYIANATTVATPAFPKLAKRSNSPRDRTEWTGPKPSGRRGSLWNMRMGPCRLCRAVWIRWKEGGCWWALRGRGCVSFLLSHV